MNIMKHLKSIASVVGASLLTLLVYFFCAIFFEAALNETTEEGAVNWILFAVMLFCAVIFCPILLWVHQYHNDDAENEFMKFYNDENPYKGMKADITNAVTSDITVYLTAYAASGVGMVSLLSGKLFEPCLAFFPMVSLMIALHPVVAFILHIAIFSVLYTLLLCLMRNRWARGGRMVGGGGVSQTHLNAQRWSNIDRRRRY